MPNGVPPVPRKVSSVQQLASTVRVETDVVIRHTAECGKPIVILDIYQRKTTKGTPGRVRKLEVSLSADEAIAIAGMLTRPF